jgi:hypothetical protein
MNLRRTQVGAACCGLLLAVAAGHARPGGASSGGCELAEGAVRPGCAEGIRSVSTRRRWCSLMISSWSERSRPRVPVILSQMASARGACGRAGENPGAVGCEYGVECAGELAGVVPDQGLDWSRAMAGSIRKLRATLPCPGAAGMGGDASQVSAASAVLDDDQVVSFAADQAPVPGEQRRRVTANAPARRRREDRAGQCGKATTDLPAGNSPG